jgi:hypothetical protein
LAKCSCEGSSSVDVPQEFILTNPDTFYLLSNTS